MQEKVVHATYALYSKPFESFHMRNRPKIKFISLHFKFNTHVVMWCIDYKKHENFHAKWDLNLGSLVNVMTGPLSCLISPLSLDATNLTDILQFRVGTGWETFKLCRLLKSRWGFSLQNALPYDWSLWENTVFTPSVSCCKPLRG